MLTIKQKTQPLFEGILINQLHVRKGSNFCTIYFSKNDIIFAKITEYIFV